MRRRGVGMGGFVGWPQRLLTLILLTGLILPLMPATTDGPGSGGGAEDDGEVEGVNSGETAVLPDSVGGAEEGGGGGGGQTREAGGPMDGGNGDPLGDGIWETPGDWYVQDGDDVTYRNLTIVVNGDLFVESGANLTVDNTTLIVNTTAPLSHGVEVASGARLDIINGSNVTAVTGADRTKLTYWPGSAGSVSDSELSRMGHTSSAFYRGARIGSNDVTVVNCTISDSYYGLYIVACDPLLTDVTVRNNDFGIYVTLSASPDITGCTLVNNKYGIHITGDSAPTILTTTVTGPITNTSGISINSNSTPTIRDCEVSGFSHWGISITHASSPYLRNVTVNGLPGTGYCIRAEESSPYIRECTVTGGWQGISLEDCTAARVWSNTVNDTQATAIYSLGGTDGSFKWNDVGGAGTQGIWLRGGDHLVQYNTVSGSGGHGIYLEEGFFNFTWENRVDVANWTGIHILNSTADLRGNVVDGAAGNGYDLTGGEVRLWNCHSYNSTGHGLMLTNGTFDVDETTAVGNGGWGVYMLNGSAGSVATDLTLGMTGFSDNAIGGYMRDVYMRVRCVDVFGDPVPGMGITVADRFGTFTHSYLPSMEPELETGPDGRTALFNVSLHLLGNDGVTGRTFTPHTLATLLPPGPGYFGNYTNVTVTGFTEVVMVMEYTVGPFVEVNQTIDHTILERFGGLLEENATAPMAEGDIVELNVTLHRWDYPQWPGVVLVPWNLTADGVEVDAGTAYLDPPGNTSHTVFAAWRAVNGSHVLRFSIAGTDYGAMSRALQPPPSWAEVVLDVNARPRAWVEGVYDDADENIIGATVDIRAGPYKDVVVRFLDDSKDILFRFDAGGEPTSWIPYGDFATSRVDLNISVDAEGNGSITTNISLQGVWSQPWNNMIVFNLRFDHADSLPFRVQSMDGNGSLGPWSEPVWFNVSERYVGPVPEFSPTGRFPKEYALKYNETTMKGNFSRQFSYHYLGIWLMSYQGLTLGYWTDEDIVSDNPHMEFRIGDEYPADTDGRNISIEESQYNPVTYGGWYGGWPTFNFTEDGNFQVTIFYIDREGGWDNHSIHILVPNEPPVASFEIVFDDDSVFANISGGEDPVTWTEGASIDYLLRVRTYVDPDDNLLLLDLVWHFTGPQLNSTSSRNYILVDWFNTPGTYTIELNVTDDDGVRDTVSATIVITSNGTDIPPGGDGGGGGGGGEGGWLDREGALVLALFVVAAVLISILLFLFIMKKRGHVFFWRDYLTRDPGFRVPVDGLGVSLAGRVDIIILKQTDAEKFRKYEMFHHAQKETPYVGVLWLTDKNEEWFIQDAVAGDLDDVVTVLNGNIDRFVAGEYRIHHYGNGTILSPDRQKEDRDEAGKPLLGELMSQAKDDSLERAKRREELAKGEETLLLKGGKEDKPTKDDLLKKAVDDSHERAEKREAARRGKDDDGKKDDGESASRPSKDDLMAGLGG